MSTTLLDHDRITSTTRLDTAISERLRPMPDLRDVACRIEHADVRIAGRRALRDCTLDVIDGEVVAIVGMPGSGRSTLARLLAGLDETTLGRVWAGGAEATRVRAAAEAVARRRQVATLRRGVADAQRVRCRELVTIELRLDGHLEPLDGMIDEAFEFAGLAHRAEVRVDRLTDSERERLAVAVALAGRCGLVVADDFGHGQAASDAERQRDIALLERLRAAAEARGTAIVVVTDDPEIAGRADRVVALESGALYADQYRVDVESAASLLHELAVLAILQG